MKVCEQCGFADNPLWKPLFWRLYWDYMTVEDFKRSYSKGFLLSCCIRKFDEILVLFGQGLIEKQYCKAGDFYFHFEDLLYYFRLSGKRATRKLVYRFPKGFESMANRKLYEKTPSEKRKKVIA